MVSILSHITEAKQAEASLREAEESITERKLSEDYVVFVQLLVDHDLIAAQTDTYPGLGSFPTSLWPAGAIGNTPSRSCTRKSTTTGVSVTASALSRVASM